MSDAIDTPRAARPPVPAQDPVPRAREVGRRAGAFSRHASAARRGLRLRGTRKTLSRSQTSLPVASKKSMPTRPIMATRVKSQPFVDRLAIAHPLVHSTPPSIPGNGGDGLHVRAPARRRKSGSRPGMPADARRKELFGLLLHAGGQSTHRASAQHWGRRGARLRHATDTAPGAVPRRRESCLSAGSAPETRPRDPWSRGTTGEFKAPASPTRDDPAPMNRFGVFVPYWERHPLPV